MSLPPSSTPYTTPSTLTDAAWHGGCLALAELARRGLLLPDRLAAVIPLTLRALHFDVRQASHSVGAHVRDAACYVVWAFARAYAPDVMRPYMQQLANGLLLLCVYDREVNVRRAACAAFQENVGRQGGLSFPHGIELNTLADYFTISNRGAAYLQVGRSIAAFPEYRRPLMDHLQAVKCRHWDRELRELACRALADFAALGDDSCQYLLTRTLPALYSGCESPDLVERHGCTLAVAEVLIVLQTKGQAGGSEGQQQLVQLILGMESRQLFSTRRSPLLRLSLSRLLTAAALYPDPLPSFSLLLSLLEDNLQHLEEEVQQSAVLALHSFWPRPELPAPVRAELVRRWVSALPTSPLMGARRGLTLALASLPASVLTGDLRTDVIGALSRGVQRGVQVDAEARRNSVTALSQVCEGLGAAVWEEVGGRDRVCDVALRAFLTGLEDYATDNRGDVGSWVREAAMRALARLLRQVAGGGEAGTPGFTQAELTEVGCGLLKQAVEKIDRLRECAAQALRDVAELSCVQGLPHWVEVRAALGVGGESPGDWSAPSVSFPRLVPLLPLAPYTGPMMAGLVLSVGGLTESVVRHSAAALTAFLTPAPPATVKLVGDSLLAVLWQYRGQARVVVPALKTVELLLTQALLDGLGVEVEATAAFMRRLCERCEKEASQSINVPKLLQVAAVLAALLGFSAQGAGGEGGEGRAAVVGARRRVLAALVGLVGHEYPKVRRVAAEALYGVWLQGEDEEVMRELVGEGGDDEGEWRDRWDDCQALLGETAWDEGSLQVQVRVKQLRQLLLLPALVPMLDKTAGGSAQHVSLGCIPGWRGCSEEGGRRNG